jgi:hypothetical protein
VTYPLRPHESPDALPEDALDRAEILVGTQLPKRKCPSVVGEVCPVDHAAAKEQEG